MTTAESPVVPTPPPLQPGSELLAGYRVVEHLRRGSTLDVYDVWNDRRRCRCVAKVLRPDRTGDVVASRRLVREGRLLLRLTHPHIVRAYEVQVAPRPAVILETLSGATLHYLLEQSPSGLRTADVAILGAQLVSAVSFLHAQRILHLDLKPSNIVSAGGITRVLDLDIAQAPGRSRGWGTRRYMAPEQVRGGHVSAATDVWGIGMVLMEAATGQAAAPPRFKRSVPRPLRRVLVQALATDPRQRPTLEELGAALDAVLVQAWEG